MIFLLILLGIVTYFLLQRSVTRITRTPVWLLWLVMMMPAFIWTAWVLLNGRKEPPIALVVLPFVLCPMLYWTLIQLGRRAVTDNADPKLDQTGPENELKIPTLQPINSQEEATLRNCFPWTVYFLKTLEYLPQAVICRGNLRTNSELAYKTIRENIEANFGDRFIVLFQNSFSGQPFFALVPNPQKYQFKNPFNQEKLTRPFVAIILLLSAVLTTTIAGARIIGISEAALTKEPNMIWQSLPYSLALISIIGIHELGHYVAARWYKIKVTLPYFIPVPFFIGTLGAFISMRSPVPHRKALFDISIAGPIAGLIVTIPLLMWGLAHSSIVPLTDQSGMLTFQALLPTGSLFFALCSKLTLGASLTTTSAINLHPVAIASYLGLIVTAFNLIPVGLLDGGHIVHAMYGQRVSMAIGQIARLLILVRATLNQELLLWAILLFFTPINNEPALDDVSELDSKRDLFGLVALALLMLIILPVPPMIIPKLFG